MPSPVGHALAAVAVGFAVEPSPATRRETIVRVGLLSAIAIAPDLDLLWGRHSAETHSVGAAAVVAAIAAWRRWPLAETRTRIFLVAFLAWISHPLLDALGRDGTPPLGVMLFWPFSTDYVLAPVRIFDAISRRYWASEFWRHNVVAILREVVILGPPAVLSLWVRHALANERSE